MKAKVLYWNDLDVLIKASYGGENKEITSEMLDKNYVELPISFDIEEKEDHSKQAVELDEIFRKLNMDDNPMGTKEMQNWIRNNELKHTSMSVGDIIKCKKGMYICLDVGWGLVDLKDKGGSKS